MFSKNGFLLLNFSNFWAESSNAELQGLDFQSRKHASLPTFLHPDSMTTLQYSKSNLSMVVLFFSKISVLLFRTFQSFALKELFLKDFMLFVHQIGS